VTSERLASLRMALTHTPPVEAERPLRIEPPRGWMSLDLGELWRYRELFFFLTWRDIKTRYVQTFLGGGWAIVQPIAQMVVFTVIFGHLAGIEPEYGVAYPLFVFSGLLPWTYFSSALASASRSVVGNSNLVSKVFVPRLVLPLSGVLSPIVDLLFAAVVLLALFVYYSRVPPWQVFAAPLFVVFALLTALGPGLWLAALNVRYRDILFAVPFLTQLWLYTSPVIYGVSFVPDRFHWLLALNPMTGVIDGFRWSVLGHGSPHYWIYATGLGVSLALVATGVAYFKHVERTFSDVI
jgi:lipopolysaccharide transport system permease protein